MLSVIIPTCNRNDLLRKCLECLRPNIQQIDFKEYEIIVSDDSRNNTAQSLIKKEFNWVQWIEGPKKGPAANRNNGAKRAKGDWLIFIDDDCIPGKDLLKEYAKGINANPNCLALEGAIFPDDENLLKKDMAECPVNTEGGCFWSANVCVNANLFKQVGGFDESFLIAAQEDQFLYYVLKQKTNIQFLPAASVTHAVRFASLNKKLKNNIILVRNWMLYSTKKGMSFTKTIKMGYIFQCRNMFSNLVSLKLKNTIVNIHTLTIALPFEIFHYAKSKFR